MYWGAIVVQEVEESFSSRKVSSSIPTPPHQVSKCPWARHWSPDEQVENLDG